jgi:hypothetical protein
MKFLCVPCDSPMKLHAMGPPDGGSLSVVYSCPECGYEMAMLTNPYETQLVQSLGVRIGPENGASAVATASAGAPVGAGSASASTGRCPFPAMMAGTDLAVRPESGPGAGPGELVPVRWTSGAEARLANIPSFVRPMARTGIEKFAREKGLVEVDEQILDQARDFFGM